MVERMVSIDTDGPVGLLVGTSLLESDLLDSLEKQPLKTGFEPVTVHRSENLVVRQRHASPDGYRPPHEINHRANLRALDAAGVSTIVSVQSTGSLDPAIEPGSLVVPHDFLNPWAPVTFYDDDRGHGVSSFSEDLRNHIIEILRTEFDRFQSEGIYFQTRGPRFETPAEATMLQDYGDIVGMTAGSEVTLACELDMDYATLCSVDNYVNGIAGTNVDLESFKDAVAAQQPKVLNALSLILANLFDLSLREE